MIISKLLLITVILVLCRMLQARCFRIQCVDTVVTTDNLYHACNNFLRLGSEVIPKVLQKQQFRDFLIWIFSSAEKSMTKLLRLHRIKQKSSHWGLNWLRGPHRAMALTPQESQQLQGRWQLWKLKAFCRALQFGWAFCTTQRVGELFVFYPRPLQL